MNQQGCTLGIDIGTTSVKVVAFSSMGQALGQASENLTLIGRDDGTAEQDPVSAYEAVNASVSRVVREITSRGHAVIRVGFSAAMHSLLAVDEDGAVLFNAMTGMDTRAKDEADALWASAQGRDIYRQTATPVHPMTPLVKLMWLSKNQPHVFQEAAKFVSLKEYIWYRWFGVWEIDASLASATGLYSLVIGEWNRSSLAVAGISAKQLSDIVPTDHVRTSIQDPSMRRVGLGDETVFNIGASDGVLANLGVGAINQDQMVLTIGTSCAVRLGSPVVMTDETTRSFCYVLSHGHFILGGPSNSGGIVLDWLYNEIMSDEHEHRKDEGLVEILQAAGQVETGDLICLPYVAGERAPLWNANAKRRFWGYSCTTRGCM